MKPVEGIKRRLWALTQKVFFRRNSVLDVYGEDCQWTVVRGSLNADSIVYSAGVGHDISFEKALVQKFGCRIVLLDPSPTGAETMSKPENKVGGIEFLPVGLAPEDGEVSFTRQLHLKEAGLEDVGTLQMAGTGYNATGETLRFPVRCLGSLMRERQHGRIDLLKMDIEGFEYGILHSVLKQRLPIAQICVEFHEFMPGIGYGNNFKTLFQLSAASYKLVALKQHDHTFFRI